MQFFLYIYPIIGHDVRRNCLCVGVTVWNLGQHSHRNTNQVEVEMEIIFGKLFFMNSNKSRSKSETV